MDGTSETQREGWIEMVGWERATGALRQFYGLFRQRASGRPSVYDPPTGDVPNIVRVHSLEPEGLRLAFTLSAQINWGGESLPWREREMLNTVTSAANGCFY